MKSHANIKELIQLIEQNMDLEIIAKVDDEIFAGEEYSWYAASFGHSEVEEYYTPDLHYIIGENAIYDYLAEGTENEPEFEEISDEQFSKIINDEIDKKRVSGEIKKAIFVTIEN